MAYAANKWKQIHNTHKKIIKIIDIAYGSQVFASPLVALHSSEMGGGGAPQKDDVEIVFEISNSKFPLPQKKGTRAIGPGFICPGVGRSAETNQPERGEYNERSLLSLLSNHL